MRNRLSALRLRWANLGQAERTIAIAGFTVLGTLAAAAGGGVCALLAGIIPPILTGEIDQQDLGIRPDDEAQATEEPLKLASFRFNDWTVGSIYASMDQFNLDDFPEEDFSLFRKRLNLQAYHVLYESSDLDRLHSQLPADIRLPHSLPPDSSSMPVVPIEYELWNLSRTDSVVIDEIEIQLDAFEEVNFIQTNLYYIAGPVGGGGSDLPRQDFELQLSPSRPLIELLVTESIRIRIDSGEALLLVLNPSFEHPGRYFFSIAIKYHTPDSKQYSLGTSNLIFSWMQKEFIDGADVIVLD